MLATTKQTICCSLLILLPAVCGHGVLGQVTVPVNPSNLQDPRVSFSNPAAISSARPHAYLGLKLIYPGAIRGNAFAMKSSLFSISTQGLFGSEVAGSINGQFFTAPLYRESRFGFVAARTLVEGLDLGVDLAVQSRTYATDQFDLVDQDDPVFRNGAGKSVFDAGIGLLFRVSDALRFGASLYHFTRPNVALGNQEARLPTESFFGISLVRQFAQVDLAVQYWQHKLRPLFGAELFASRHGRLRLGFALDNASVEGQLVLRQRAAFFYSFSLPTSDLGLVSAGSHEFGLVYELGKPSPSGKRASEEELALHVVPERAEVYPGETAKFSLRMSGPAAINRTLEVGLSRQPAELEANLAQNRLASNEETVLAVHAKPSARPGTYRLRLVARSHDVHREQEIEILVSAPPRLFASVSATVDTVVITEFRQIREELPLIPRVFFARNSSRLAESRYDLLSPQQSAGHFEDVREINAAYRNLLNIIAGRLRTHPEVRVTIRGYSPGAPVEANPEELSGRRARYVHDYFVKNLHVDPAQIQIEIGTPNLREASSHDPLRLEELQRVEIVVGQSDETTILAPIMSEKKEIDAIPPRAGFVCSELSKGAGLRRWSLVILANQDTVEVISGSESLPDTIWWNWQFDARRQAEFWQQVRYSLQLEDRLGQTHATPWQTILRKRTKSVSSQIEKIPLILFAFDEFALDVTSSRLRLKLQQIAEKLAAEPEARCVLYGHTDSIGDEEHNLQLSRRRAENVLKELVRLGISAGRLSFEGYGETRPLADNRLPEGRMINRRVEVRIRHVSDTVKD